MSSTAPFTANKSGWLQKHHPDIEHRSINNEDDGNDKETNIMMVTRRNIFNNTGRASMLIVNPVMGVEDGSHVPNVMICFYYLRTAYYDQDERNAKERTKLNASHVLTQGGHTKDGDILEDV